MRSVSCTRTQWLSENNGVPRVISEPAVAHLDKRLAPIGWMKVEAGTSLAATPLNLTVQGQHDACGRG